MGPLVLVREPGGFRHELSGRPVHAGNGLELRCPDGSWLPGVYEWTFEPGDTPVLKVDGMWGPVVVELSDDAVLRWPARWFGR